MDETKEEKKETGQKAEETKAEETKKEEPKEEPKEEEVEVPSKFQDIVSKIEEMSVVDLAELVKVLEKKFGVSASVAVVSGPSAGAGQAAEKTSFNVILKSAGGQKINVIKAVKEITGVGLKEAKDLVEGAPKPVKEGVKKEEAEEMKKKLEEAGAEVELQ